MKTHFCIMVLLAIFFLGGSVLGEQEPGGELAEALAADEMAQAGQDDGLGAFAALVRGYPEAQRRIGDLREEQSRVLEQLQRMREMTGADPELADVDAREGIRQALHAAQENEESIRQIQTELLTQARVVSARAPEVRSSFEQMRGHVERRLGDTHGGSDAESGRMQDRIARHRAALARMGETLDLMVETEDVERRTSLLLGVLKELHAGDSGLMMGPPLLGRFEERLLELERSQRLLQWRLDENEREMQALRRVLERFSRRHRLPGGGREGMARPGRPAQQHEGLRPDRKQQRSR